MPEQSQQVPPDLEERLNEIDARLRQVQSELAPDRDDPKLRWVSVGAVVAVVVWVLASVGFSLYVNLFGSYNKTYGALAGIVILLMWLWLSLVAVLLGAEINAEMEKQTVKDTTTGPEKPLGRRDAVKADLRTPSSSTRSDEAVG